MALRGLATKLVAREGIKSLSLAVAVFLAFKINGRPQIVGDAFPATLAPVAVIRGDGPFLDRYGPLLFELERGQPYYVASCRGHLVSCYPPGSLLAYVPLIGIQSLLLDVRKPGWDSDPHQTLVVASFMAKNAAALLVAATIALLHCLLIQLRLARFAVPACIAAGLGSSLWMVASQAAWQHAPAALTLVASLLSLTAEQVTRRRLVLAGLFTALLVTIRPIDLPFSIAIALWVLRYHTRRMAWFLPFPLILGGLFIAHNFYFFGSVVGGQVQLDVFNPIRHAVKGSWSGEFLPALAGTLFSPARGLFVYCPWVALSILILPAWVVRLSARSVTTWALVALVPFGLLISSYSVWWAGQCFGPRYWTEAVPLLAVMFAQGLDWAKDRARSLLPAFALAVYWSVAVQAIGAAAYPTGWETDPVDIDLRPERLWDWKDTEISRALGISRL